MKLRPAAFLFVAALAGGLHATVHEIRNPALTVRFDQAAGAFTVTDRSTRKA